MPSVYLTSDQHYGHQGVCRFLRADGTKLRPWDNAEEMNEELVKRHNEVVKPTDKVYFLGDVAIARKSLQILHRLNGDKVLIKGNHDIFKLKDYVEHFRDIRGYHVMNGIILSHIPVHTSNLYRFGSNIHGHTHANRVMMTDEHGVEKIDPNFFSVCVEQTNYTPILFENVLKKIKEQGGVVGFKNPRMIGNTEIKYSCPD